MKIFLLFAAVVCIGSVGAVDLDAAVICEGGPLLEKIRGFVSQWTQFCDVMDRTQLKITYVGNVLTIAVGADSSESLSDLLPNTGVKFLDGDNRIDIESLIFDFNDPWSLSVKTRSYPSIEIVPEYMSIEGAVADLTVGKGSNQRVVLSSLNVGGTWKVGSLGIVIGFKKDGNVYTFSGAPVGNDVNIGAFVEALGEQLLPQSAGAALRKAGFGGFTLKDVKLTGYYDSEKDNLAFCLTGSPTIQNLGGNRLHVLFHRYQGGAHTAVTIGVTFESFRLSSLIQKVSGIDASRMPIIGSLVVPDVGLLVSTRDVEPNFLPDCVDGILKDTSPFPEGLSIIVRFKITSDASPSKFLIRIDPNLGVAIEPLENGNALTLPNVARAIGIGLDSLQLPPGINNLLSASVSTINYDKTKGILTATLNWGDELVLVPNLLKIKKPFLNINMTTTAPRSIEFDAHGQWVLGPTTFEVAVLPQDGGKKGYVLKGSGSLLNFGDIGASVFPSGLVVDFLRNFEIVDPCVSIPIGEVAQTQKMLICGTPRIAGFNGPRVYVLTKKINGRQTGALGFDFANTGFAGILKKLTGKSISGVKLFDQGLKLGVILAAADFPGETFDGPTLTKLGEIKKGLTLAGVFNLPPCGNDPICKFLAVTLGSGVSLQLKATIPNTREFKVTAGLASMKLGNGMILQSAGLELVVSSMPSVGITCELLVQNPRLLFTGSFRALPTGELQASMTMEGLWKRAFGLNFLTIGNILFSIKFVPGATPTAFELGGELHIGSSLKGAGYIGVDTTNPKQNYFYVSLRGVTLTNLMTTFGIRLGLIKPLRELGFVGELVVSYSTVEKRVPGRTIPAGFQLKGFANILGFRLRTHIQVSPGNSIKLDLEMSPLVLAGGMFRMYAHPNQKSRGPYLKAEISLRPRKVALQASGYVELFGFMKTGATLKILEKEYLMEVRRPFFAIFQAYLRIYANFGSLKQASFGVYGELDTSWLNDLKNKVVSAIKRGADEATRKISAAQRKVDDAKRPVDNAQRSLREKRDKVNRLCSIRSCSRNCVGCPRWNGCCRKVWGRCIGCPGWNGCCTRITDPICAAANLACEGVRKVAYAALWAAEKALNLAKAPFEAAKKILEGVKAAVRVGASAASWIVSRGLGSLIAIRKISFQVNIAVVGSGSFGGAIEVSFLKSSYKRIGFHLRFRGIWDMVKDLADRVFKGISGRRRRDVEQSLRAAFPDYALREPYKPGSYRPKRDELDEFSEFAIEEEFNAGLEDDEPTTQPTLVPIKSIVDDEIDTGDDEGELRAQGDEVASRLHELARGAEHSLDDDKITASDNEEEEDVPIFHDLEIPTTDEGRCKFFKERIGPFMAVFEVIESTVSELVKEVQGVNSQKALWEKCRLAVDDMTKNVSALEISAEKEADDFRKVEEESNRRLSELGPRTKREVSERSGEVRRKVSEAVAKTNENVEKSHKICDELGDLYQGGRGMAVSINARGARLPLASLDALTHKHVNKSFDRFLHDECEKVVAIYENYEGERKEAAQQVKAAVQSACKRFGYEDGEENIADSTLIKARTPIRDVLARLTSVRGLKVFCA